MLQASSTGALPCLSNHTLKSGTGSQDLRRTNPGGSGSEHNFHFLSQMQLYCLKYDVNISNSVSLSFFSEN